MVIIMARIELKMYDEVRDSYIKLEAVNSDLIFKNSFIKIKIFDVDTKVENIINLDKSTAIKLSKVLRTEINKITEREVHND
jgi:hypothetical protein